MRTKAGLILALAVIAAGRAFAQGLSPEQIDESLVRLEIHMKTIHDQAQFTRRLNSGLLVGTGALIGGGGYFIAANTITEDYPEMRNAVFGAIALYSGIFIVPGVLTYAILTEAERIPNSFFAMGGLTAAERQRKVIQGELMLKTMSDNSFMRRMIGGLICLAGGAGQIAWYLSERQEVDPYYYSYDSVYDSQTFVYSGCAMAAGGLALIVFKSRAESEYSTYDDWKRGLAPKKSVWDFLFGLGSKGEPAIVARLTL